MLISSRPWLPFFVSCTALVPAGCGDDGTAAPSDDSGTDTVTMTDTGPTDPDGTSTGTQDPDGTSSTGTPDPDSTGTDTGDTGPVEACGNGVLDPTEACDDDNLTDGDGCTADCQVEDGFSCDQAPSVCVATCGDGLVVGEEQCDDQGVEPDDGCDANCVVELGWSCEGEPSTCMTGCGDGIEAGSEECDDADVQDGDGCSAACVLEPGWICTGAPSMCLAECGDGIIVGDEACDDDDTVPGDGCDDLCQIDEGWYCTGEPSECASVCGDGVTASNESCDDGDIAAGNGCGLSCEVEFGWACAGTPSACALTETLGALALGGNGGCVLSSAGNVGCFGNNTQGEVGNDTTGIETYIPTFALDAAAMIAAGESFHCALRLDDSVWCWGDNASLAMGPGAAAGVDQLVPIEITGLPATTAIATGDDHACAIAGMGQVWCWGENGDRQLGLGGAGITDSATPAAVTLPGGLMAIDLGLGQSHSCAVLEDNTVACWGDDDNGQLGDGTAGTDSGVATVVPGLASISDVEAGEDTTCALDTLGQVWCWGDNVDGAVGDDTTTDNPSPQLVDLPSAAQAIALGDQFSCALLLSDEVYCWGEGADYQLGSGDLAAELLPTAVIELPALDFVAIEAGGRGVCVISTADERWCWGRSEEGQLGIAPLFQFEPTTVAFSGPVASLALDRPEYRGVLCGVMLDGTVECSGDGALVSASPTGAQGYFEPITHNLGQPTTLPLVADAESLAMGSNFICTATSTDVQCWGDNISLQLGQGGVSTVDILTPVSVVGLGAVDELDLGSQFACVRTGGTVQCWGENASLQTGNGGTTSDQSSPVTVAGLSDAVAITLGEGHACALRDSGEVRCWGEDGVGQLGDNDGDVADSATPVDVTGLPAGVVQIAAGQDHTCALADGDVYCWGEGQYGQLGQGTEADSDTALLVPGLADIVRIASGYNYVCAVDDAGDMWCWGYGLDGQLGNGGQPVTGLSEFTSPTPFFVANGITDVVAGNSVTCIDSAAGWQCLGFRSAGQLGDGTTVAPAVPTPMSFGL